ncbi:MarR family winged helix-turn-helix transcriptional regulator [Nocardia nova]|uniref:MarR family winged helix-turn-helix transcriptional regulator n=1 Tax=Nocardia nova TaxID=37330 RepID=UPI0033F69637
MIESQAVSAGDSAHDGLADTLVQSAFVTMAVLTRIAAENDLSLTQVRVLGILRDRRVRITALAGYLGLDKSTMTGLVRRAEERGLLQREPNPDDGRVVDVVLTEEAGTLVETVRERVGRELSSMTDALAPGEQRRLQSLLRRMLESGPS